MGHLWPLEDQDTTGVNECRIGGDDVRKPWEEIIHHLTARSVIRDFEKLAEKESETGHGDDRYTHYQCHIYFRGNRNKCVVTSIYFHSGSGKRYRMKAIQTSKHCNIICMYTAFTITNGSTSKGLAESTDVRNTGML